MMDLINFTDFKLSDRNLQYAGRAGEKRGIIYNGEHWFLKFPKNTIGMNNVKGISYVTSPISEYIGSNIFKILNVDVQDTKLGIYFDGKRNKVVCACKDFIIDDKNELLIPYTALRNDTNPIIIQKRDTTLDSASNIDEILFQLINNTILKQVKNTSDRFYTMITIDFLINNNDRNEDNWGVIKYKNENSYKIAPIYDCGNSFYSKASEERINSILNDYERLISSSLNGVTAYEDEKGNRISLLKILNYVKLNNPLILEKIYIDVINNLEKINKLINDIPNTFENVDIISENRKTYYLKTFNIRLDYLKNIINS